MKNPILGKVKTRLAETIGDTKALEIYNDLLLITKDLMHDLEVTKYVYYSDFIEENDLWNPTIFTKRIQTGQDLGQRMYQATKEVMEIDGYQNVVIVGTDCPFLTKNLIMEAFEQLRYNSFVLGPAYDGGYYLLGMRQLRIEIFEKIIWGGSRVLTDTIHRINKMVKTFYQLSPLMDIDTEQDYIMWQKTKKMQ
jgi:uncharacterized protein